MVANRETVTAVKNGLDPRFFLTGYSRMRFTLCCVDWGPDDENSVKVIVDWTAFCGPSAIAAIVIGPCPKTRL